MSRPVEVLRAWLWERIYLRLICRPCRGCADTSFHNAHLTWLGRRRYHVGD